MFRPKKAECRSPMTAARQPSKPAGRSRKTGAKRVTCRAVLLHRRKKTAARRTSTASPHRRRRGSRCFAINAAPLAAQCKNAEKPRKSCQVYQAYYSISGSGKAREKIYKEVGKSEENPMDSRWFRQFPQRDVENSCARRFKNVDLPDPGSPTIINKVGSYAL